MVLLYFITTAIVFIAALVLFHLSQRTQAAQISRLVSEQRAQIESIIVGLKSSNPVYEFAQFQSDRRNEGQVESAPTVEAQEEPYPFNFLRADGRDFEIID